MPKLTPVSERQNHRCCYCSHTMVLHKHNNGKSPPRAAATRDHLVPRALGGQGGNNIVAACVQCNHLRGDMDYIAFHNLLRKLFKRNPSIHERWHELTDNEIHEIWLICLHTHERQLAGLAMQSVEHAFQHFKLLDNMGHHFLAVR